LGKDVDPVYAFRVDSTRHYVDIGGTDTCTITQVPLLGQNWSPPETRASLTYGYFVFGVAVNFPVFTSHSVAVRLYRPGYELVEIDSWEVPGKVNWQRAPGLEDQERTLDHLFSMEGKARNRHIGKELLPGSASADHGAALEFGASEYELLVTTGLFAEPISAEVRARLIQKAEKLRRLAAD
jgi:hypothetical protein